MPYSSTSVQSATCEGCVFLFSPLLLNLVGSIGVTCRSKEAKLIPIGNPRWPPSWKYFCFASSPEPKGQLTRNFEGSSGMTGRSKIAKIPIWNLRRSSWKSFFASPESKGQLTWNLLGSNGETCRSNIAKIIPIGSPTWPSWKSIFRFFSWTERSTDLNLIRKYQGLLVDQI